MVNSTTSVYKSLGFSLIELLVVLVILAILAAIAYPNYIGYIERGNRADVMSEMQQIASRIESNKLIYKRYDKIPLSSIFPQDPTSTGSTKYPKSDTALYTISLTPVINNKLGGGEWELVATPISNTIMDGNGNLTLDYEGKKCWKPVGGNKCGKNDEWR